jgi:hypothetical protein
MYVSTTLPCHVLLQTQQNKKYVCLNSKTNKLRGFIPQSELYGPSDRRLSAKLVPILKDRGVAWSAQRIPTAVNFGFLDRSS